MQMFVYNASSNDLRLHLVVKEVNFPLALYLYLDRFILSKSDRTAHKCPKKALK